MLTSIEIENFKGIGRTIRIDLRPITLLFGPNSAGKSTVLHALHYAHEILSRRNFNPNRTSHGGELVDLGGFRNFVHQHDLARTIWLRFEMEFSDQEMSEFPVLYPSEDNAFEGSTRDLEFYNFELGARMKSGWLKLGVRWSEARSTAILSTYELGIDSEIVARIESSEDGARADLLPNLLHPLLECFAVAENPEETRRLVSQVFDFPLTEDGLGPRLELRGLSRSSLPRWGENLDFDFPLSAYRSANEDPPEAVASRISAILVGVGEILRDEIAQFRYLGPMRDVVPRSYMPPRVEESFRWASGVAAWDLLLSRGQEFVSQVDGWLAGNDRLRTGHGLAIHSLRELPEESALMVALRSGTLLDDVEDLRHEIDALPLRTELRLVDAQSGLVVQPSDVGLGVSQVLPVVVAALDPDRPSITAIEQPELHIHPRVQVELGDLFAQQASDGRIFLLETHSEHLMLRLLRRIEETHSGELPAGKPALRPDQVSVVFVEQIDGEVKATRLRIDETGEFIDRWPRGFFEERAGELI